MQCTTISFKRYGPWEILFCSICVIISTDAVSDRDQNLVETSISQGPHPFKKTLWTSTTGTGSYFFWKLKMLFMKWDNELLTSQKRNSTFNLRCFKKEQWTVN